MRMPSVRCLGCVPPTHPRGRRRPARWCALARHAAVVCHLETCTVSAGASARQPFCLPPLLLWPSPPPSSRWDTVYCIDSRRDPHCFSRAYIGPNVGIDVAKPAPRTRTTSCLRRSEASAPVELSKPQPVPYDNSGYDTRLGRRIRSSGVVKFLSEWRR